MSGMRETIKNAWPMVRRLPRLFAAVLTYVIRSPRLVLEAGGRVDHREAMDKHLRKVWAEVGSGLRDSGRTPTLAGRSEP